MAAGATQTFDSGAATSGGEATVSYLACVLDSAHPLEPPARWSLADVDEVVVGRAAERSAARQQVGGRRLLQLGFPDTWMSSIHFRLQVTDGVWTLRDAGSKNGTLVGGVRTASVAVDDGTLLCAGLTFFLFRRAEAVDDAGVRREFATLHPTLEARLGLAARVAPTPVPLLLTGETGTGKEVLARAIHDWSGRPGPFVAVNCGAIPATLIEAELFGHRRGAFSGATEDRIGFVRASDRGTLFLDEIAELAEPCQTALLRVLQEREVVPVGETRPTKVDLRVVAATHRDLDALVAEGRFRRDLFARVQGYEVGLPPLRERREDIGLLIGLLLPRVAGDRAARLRLHRDAALALLEHDWPDNVRELEHTLAAAVALTTGDEIGLAQLPASIVDSSVLTEVSEDAESRRRFRQVCEKHKGNISAIARDLGTSRSQVRRLAERHGVRLEELRGE